MKALCSLIGRLNKIRRSIFLIYRPTEIPIKIPEGFLWTYTSLFSIYMNGRGPRIALKKNLTKQHIVGEIPLPNLPFTKSL